MDGSEDSGSLLDIVKDLSETGTAVYKAVNQQQTPVPASANANLNARKEADTNAQLSKYLPLGIGAFVVLILAIVLLRK